MLPTCLLLGQSDKQVSKKQKKMVRIHIDNGVMRRGLQNKAKSCQKLTFLAKKHVPQSTAYASFLLLMGHCAKKKKRGEFFTEFLCF